MATSEQLEREAEASRAQIAATLDELRGRMTAGQIVDELVDYARDSGGADFFRNFGRQVVGNPIPVTLVGAGLAWLMMAGRRGSAPSDDIAAGMSDAGRLRRKGDRSPAAAARSDDITEGMSDAGRRHETDAAGLSDHAVRRAHEWAQQTRDTAARLNQGAGEMGASLRETAGAAGEAVRDGASAAYDTASAAYTAAAERSRQGADAIADSARRMGDRVAAGGQGFLTLLQEQPLVLAGLGLAIGSLLGASLPITDAEDKLMGEASDAAKDEAKARAAEQVEKAKTVAAETWRAAKSELDGQVGAGAGGPHAGSSDQARAATEPGQGATLVPSDHGNPTDSAADGGRREAAQRAE